MLWFNAIVRYRTVGHAKNYIETPKLKRKHQEYLQACYSEEYKDHLFVWQDESYVHQNHVRAHLWLATGDTIYRNTSGHKYIMVHAGCKDCWIGMLLSNTLFGQLIICLTLFNALLIIYRQANGLGANREEQELRRLS